MEQHMAYVLNEGKQAQTDAILAMTGNGSGHVGHISRHSLELIENTLRAATGPVAGALSVFGNIAFSDQNRK